MFTAATTEKAQTKARVGAKAHPTVGRGVQWGEEEALEACECLMDIAAALFNVSGKEMRRPGRTSLGVSRVRQISMYVAHVTLGLNMSDVGRGFGRDRTTVVYACHLIEDMRDVEEFDGVVAMMERVIIAAFGDRLER